MLKIDHLTKDYMSDPRHFADAFNYYLFAGRQVIREESLAELDTTEISIIVKGSDTETTQKYRDVLKQCVLKENQMAAYILLGIENQSDVHYAMVVKNLIYDALHYGKQVAQTTKLHRDAKDTTGAGFLSGFTKDDRLKPIITLTVYFGADDWDAPRSLHDMLEPVHPDILRYVNDYRLNLIVPKEIKDFSLFTSELKNVLQFIAGSDDEMSLRQIRGNKSYEHLQADTVHLINACTSLKIPVAKGEKEVNVCKGFDDLVRHESEKAVIQASIEAWQDADFTKEDILSRLRKKYQLDETAAAEYYEQFSTEAVV